MAGFARALHRFNAVAAKIMLWVAALGMLYLTAITGWQVFGRYVLNDTPQWVERTAIMLILYVSFLAGAVGVRDESHLGIAFIIEAAPAWFQRVVAVGGDLVMAAFGAGLVWYGLALVESTWPHVTPILGIPEGATYLALPLGGVFIVLFALEHLLGARAAAPPLH